MKSRGDKGLAVRYRPVTFSECIGYGRLLSAVRQKFAQPKSPAAVMFSGATGTGKTTIARILSVAVNCPHQMAETFGDPCLKCRRRRDEFDIMEPGSADKVGREEVKEQTASYLYAPLTPSLRRVFILDEFQRASAEAQAALLKPFEDGPRTTFWIVCTTEPNKVLPALRNRCVHWVVPTFTETAIEELITTVCESEKAHGHIQTIPSEKIIGEFVENLVQTGQTSPRSVLTNLEKLLVGEGPDCVFGAGSGVDVRLGRFILQGDWNRVRMHCKGMSSSELISARNLALGYLRAVLVGAARDGKTHKLVETIAELASADGYEENLVGGKIVVALYNACRRFSV